MADTVVELAAGIVALGIEPGSRISLFCSTRMEFTLLDYAIWAAGCATVTIYETSSAEQVQWIVGNSDSVALLCETVAMREMYEEIADSLPECQQVLVIEDGALDHLKSLATDDARAEVQRRIGDISHDHLATLVYTSGTTGRPKGCIITHHNFIWTVRSTESDVRELVSPPNRQLMFLPLAHIFARLVQVTCVSGGVTMAFSTGIPQLTEELAMFKPTWVFSVPRVFEKIYNGAKQKAHADGKGAIFDRAANVAVDYSKGLQDGGPGLATKLQHALFDRLVYSKLRALFGGQMEHAISGGAPLGARLGHFFRGVGLVPLEGYGLTETTAASSVNTPQAIKIGSVGRPLPGVSAKIAEDGEIMLKGGNIFSGYWRNDAATADALEPDGWFHSGDLGELDENGFLSITGRKKEIIVTAAGKNVAPAVLEDRLRAGPLISQVMVIGDAQPFISALITLDEEALPAWAEANGKESADVADLKDDPDLIAAVQADVDEANKAVSRAESIRTFRILPEDLTVEGGELTPTLKVKRQIVEKKYEGVISDIYQ
jgi:long-chain acyl-CoA synthetase